MVSLTELHLRAARARIAAAVMPPPVEPRLGSIQLRADQRASAARAATLIAREGGCLLADDVGHGKTYVALALARAWSRPLVVAPASLRSTWLDAMRRAEVTCALVSHEALSRGRTPPELPDGIIVDESHRFRSTDARRYAALASLAARARLLLLSATPFQNRSRELAAQIALFHGGRAFRLDTDDLARFVVRGAAHDETALPRVAPPEWIRPVADDGAVLEAILTLPPPARPTDGGDAGVLRTISLVRAWASSRAALRATLRTRRRVAAAIEQCAAAGRVPTRHELRSWYGDDGTIQLGFALMLATGSATAHHASELLETVEREHVALRRVESAMVACEDPDEARVRAIRAIRAAHPGESMLAFTELASTARSYYSHLRGDAGVGLLTSHDARIASGRLSRDALLSRFAPRARHAPTPAEHERVTLLIATDLLSEGVNLQDASVVVHLDLPWNPARLAQRVGRVRRPGGAAVVHAYLVAPPARAELLLDVEERLRRKLADVARTIGRGIDVVPRLVTATEPPGAGVGRATMLGEVAQRIARWARPAIDTRHATRRATAAAVECEVAGWLAALDDGRIIAALDGRPAGDDAIAARATLLCESPPRRLRSGEGRGALAECQRWLDSVGMAQECGRTKIPHELDLTIEHRIAEALGRCARHERATVAAIAGPLRALLGAPRPIGLEWELEELLRRAPRARDASWMTDAVNLMSAGVTPRRLDESPRIVALVALGPRE